jgi:hypothetical protein
MVFPPRIIAADACITGHLNGSIFHSLFGLTPLLPQGYAQIG